MKEYKVRTAETCKNCALISEDDCDGCEHDHEQNYHEVSETIYTMTYGDLLDIPDSERDDVMRDVIRILGVAERVGRGETDFGEYLLALEETVFTMLDGVEFCDDGRFRFLSIAEIPAAFTGYSDRRNFRFFVQDSEMTRALNTYELDAQFGLIAGGALFDRRWRIWLADDVADNLVEESRRLHKVYRFCSEKAMSGLLERILAS